MKEHLQIKNGYTNIKDRVSFSIEIHTCDQNTDSSCKSNEEIENLLKKMYFTMYYLEEAVSFKDSSLLNKRPLKTKETFHS